MYIVVVAWDQTKRKERSSSFKKILRLLPAATEQLGKMKGYLPECGDQNLAEKVQFQLELVTEDMLSTTWQIWLWGAYGLDSAPASCQEENRGLRSEVTILDNRYEAENV